MGRCLINVHSTLWVEKRYINAVYLPFTIYHYAISFENTAVEVLWHASSPHPEWVPVGTCVWLWLVVNSYFPLSYPVLLYCCIKARKRTKNKLKEHCDMWGHLKHWRTVFSYLKICCSSQTRGHSYWLCKGECRMYWYCPPCTSSSSHRRWWRGGRDPVPLAAEVWGVWESLAYRSTGGQSVQSLCPSPGEETYQRKKEIISQFIAALN